MRDFKDLEASTFQKHWPAYRYLRRADQLPLYSQIAEEDGHTFDNILCRVRLFNPGGAGTWWIAAYDPEDRIAWGVAEIHTREVGSIGMAEIVAFRSRYGLPIERDLHYTPMTIAAVLDHG